MKSTPHFSHLPPARCLLPHAGQSNRIVLWQRWQNRATSRTAVPHLGHFTVGCGTGGVNEALVAAGAVAGFRGGVGFLPRPTSGGDTSAFPARATAASGPPELPDVAVASAGSACLATGFTEGVFSATTHFSGGAQAM
ncbi:MAG: hypothetical protein WAN14_07595 [Candidatus Acidiferrales bacterium]